MEQKTSRNGWNDTIEELLQKTKVNSGAFKTMYDTAADYMKRMGNRIINSVIASSFFSTACTVTGFFLYPKETMNPMSITAIGLSLVSLLMCGSLKVSQVEDWAFTYKSASSGYEELEVSIENQLSLSRNDRSACSNYVQCATDHYECLVKMSPELPHFVLRDYERKYGFIPDSNRYVYVPVENTRTGAQTNYATHYETHYETHYKNLKKDNDEEDILSTVTLHYPSPESRRSSMLESTI